MKVFVIGANGQIGKHVVRMLKDSKEHTVTAMVRKEAQAQELKQAGVEAVVANLEESAEKLQEAMTGSDAVIFTAGSGGSTGADKTMLIDLDGAIKSVEAAEKSGVSRFIMVSALQAHNRESWGEGTPSHYYVAKHYADRALMNSSLTYTIVRPGGLLNEPGTGKITAAENLREMKKIPREDVARVVVGSLNKENTHYKSFDLLSGETGIEEALKNI
ncbi:SDR family oxidoreductase [Virgibacillus sp. YIM 98842]|uniref:SDR family oxidoreductase n=1 Tax=Virgibacillus sp. YIM 98842 TaxID=2663533 RepID=UPI0013DAC5AA|nr:SDR family oxidoreductase [Virgibacillus sp. YIM 98842]